MAETYIPYGEEQIEYAPLMKNMADDVVNYANSQPWSAKRKNRFMEAYSDIVSNGITGADNKSGLWAVNLSGNIDINSMSKKDKDIYQEAAYYILLKMKGAPVQKKETEEDKSKLLLYDNNWHQKALTGYIGNNMFGGQNWDYTTQWDTLDKRDEKTGILETSKRMAKLADMLEGYGNSLEEGKYNFEGTAFKDLNDLKSRISNAVSVLRKGTMDLNVIDALNAVGIDYRTYLHDGSDETITLQDGTTITRGLYLKALQEQEIKSNELKALLQKQQILAKLKANAGVMDRISGITSSSDIRTRPDDFNKFLANTYGVGEKGFNAINLRIQTLLNNRNGLSNKDKKELGNLLYHIRTNNPNYLKSNITDLEWAELSIHNKLLGSQNRAGFVRLPWQTSDGRYTFADDKGNVYFLKPRGQLKLAAPIRRNNIDNYKKNFLTKTDTVAANLEWLKQEGFNDADLAELGGIVLDIASIVDLEPISAGTLGVAAAGARNYARAKLPKSWSIGDYLTQGMDYGLGALGFIPGVGDALLAGKTVKNIAKIGKRLLTIPAVADMAMHTPGAYDALKKAVNGESLTVGDWKNLGSFFRGLAGTRNITVQNRAARRVLEKKGYDLSDLNSWLKKSGLLDTNIPKTQTAVKVNVNGKQTEIALKGDSKQKLDLELKKAGNNQAAKDKAIRETPEVKAYIEKNKLKSEDVSAIESSSIRNSKLFGNRVGILPKSFRSTEANYSKQAFEKPTGENTFEEYLKGDRSMWDKFKYGSNRTLRGAERYINSFGHVSESLKTPTLNIVKRETPLTEDQAKTLKENVKNWRKEYRDILNINKNKGRNYEWSKNDVGINPDRLKSEIKLGDKELKFEIVSDGELLINGEKTSINAFGKSGKRKARKKIKEVTLKTIKKQRLKRNTKEFEKLVLELKKLKSTGFLQKGGLISSDTIISEFLNKLK